MKHRTKLLAWAMPLLFMLAAACSGGSDGSTEAAADSTPSMPVEIPTATPVPPSATPAPTATPVPPTATPLPPELLPIIDLHFHPSHGWGEGLAELFDELRVRAAGNGAAGPSSVGLDAARLHPGRVLPFAGGNEVGQLSARHGAAFWNLEIDEAGQFLEELEEWLEGGEFWGIGEILLNNWSSNIPGSAQHRYAADSPLMQRLFTLSADYGLPLSVHMDAEAASVEGMERLLAGNRDATWLWAHTGHHADPALLRRLFEEHPNLYGELSYRIGMNLGRVATPIDVNGHLTDDWRALLEDYPDRFVIGTDLSAPSPSAYAAQIAYWRGLLMQLSPEAAAGLAHRNAERLLGLDPQ